MDRIVIRTAGPYTITSDGDRYYSNDRQAYPSYSNLPANAALLLDTGSKGANGKSDWVMLTAEQVAMHKAHELAVAAEITARPSSIRKKLAEALYIATELAAQEREEAIAALHRNGRGALAKDRTAEIAAARAALEAFDAANPDVAAEAAAKRQAESDRRAADVARFLATD